MEKVIDVPVKIDSGEISYEAYLARTGEEKSLVEWTSGEVIIHMPPRDKHQAILSFLHSF